MAFGQGLRDLIENGRRADAAASAVAAALSRKAANDAAFLREVTDAVTERGAINGGPIDGSLPPGLDGHPQGIPERPWHQGAYNLRAAMERVDATEPPHPSGSYPPVAGGHSTPYGQSPPPRGPGPGR
jgi:cytochrome c1